MYTKVTYNFETSGRTVSSLEVNPAVSNMANLSQLATNLARDDLGYNGFILGTKTKQATKLNGTHKMFSGSHSYPGYIGSSVYTTEEVDETFELSVNGDTPKYLVLCFDGQAHEYATAYTIQNSSNANTIVITNSNEILSIVDLSSLQLPEGTWYGTLTLHITRWSQANRTVKITVLRAGELDVLQFYESELISYECSEHVYDSQLSITPGICEQYADITIYDRYKIFERANKEIECRVTIETVNPDRVLGTYYVQDWDIPGGSSEFTSHCGDFCSIFDKLTFQATSIQDRTLHQILQLIFAQGNLRWAYLNEADELFCSQLHTPNNWFKTSTVHVALEKACWLGLLRIYWDKDTFIVTRAVVLDSIELRRLP